jgi:amino-acid N-acetyltransferase
LPVVRKARLTDVPALFKLVNQYARQNVTLPRSLADLYENFWEFTVGDWQGSVVACGALQIYSEELAEIRSLCVDSGSKAGGMGSAITNHLMHEARDLGLKRVFALTLVPGFFSKMGFYLVERDALPLKVWRDCLHCKKYICCDEKAMVFELDKLFEPAHAAQPGWRQETRKPHALLAAPKGQAQPSRSFMQAGSAENRQPAYCGVFRGEAPSDSS